jgi:hypothetical protein
MVRVVAQKTEGRGLGSAVDTGGFILRDVKSISLMNDANGSINRINDDDVGPAEFTDAEVLRTFVETKPDVDSLNFAQEMLRGNKLLINLSIVIIVELEVLANESKRLTSPFACIGRQGNYVVTYAAAKS